LTVENHRTNICRKLDIHGSHVLLRFALRYKTELL
jgi:DNA-binding CsgD family transcriptional regulator